MKLRVIIHALVALGLTLCLLVLFGRGQDSHKLTSTIAEPRPLNMLVLGDSIMWGQGLRPANKSSYQIRLWLAERTGRKVVERIEAHSGAIIAVRTTTESDVPISGEVNRPAPTLLDQVQRATRYYSSGSEVDIVLVNGCVNDVGVRNILNAANTTDEIRRMTEAKCGETMKVLLRSITSSFPTAYVIVTGYYPIITEKTDNDIFMRALTKAFYKAIVGASPFSQNELFKRMIANSNEWYRSSNKSLGEAVDGINGELGVTKPPGRIMFVKMNFLPEQSLRASKTQLWNFENSPIRKLMVILSLGRILLRTNDETRSERKASCREFWKVQPGATPEQKRERKNQELLCRSAALGHPNRLGAKAFSAAIEERLEAILPALGSN